MKEQDEKYTTVIPSLSSPSTYVFIKLIENNNHTRYGGSAEKIA